MKQAENMSMKRCLIIACSKAKLKDEVLLPAINRYDGPLFRVLRKYLLSENGNDTNLSIFILSARYGLISATEKIPYYDATLSSKKINELRPQVLQSLEKKYSENFFEEIFLALGKKYQTLIEGFAENTYGKPRIFYSVGGNGLKGTHLKRWLYMDNKVKISEPKVIKSRSNNIRGKATLCGREFQFTYEEILEIANNSLQKGVGNSKNFRGWYVEIGNLKVGPKWLVSQLTSIPLSKFTSGEARRVLRQFGIKTIPHN